MNKQSTTPVDPVVAERQKRLRIRNLAVLAALVAFMMLVFIISITKMQINS